MLKDVSKSYGNVELGPVDLEGEPVFVVAGVGSNGGSNGTLIRMRMNLILPDAAYPGPEGCGSDRDRREGYYR